MLSIMDAIYHYCSNDTFLKIITGSSIHLSSLSISNDRMEGKLVIDLMKEWASKNINPEPLRRDFLMLVENINSRYDGLGFCLSEEGDLLSQWRGYADDGKGISIGFSKDYLESIANKSLPGIFPEIRLHKIEYDSKKQSDLLQSICENIKGRIDAGALEGEGLQPIQSTEASPDTSGGGTGTYYKDHLFDLFNAIHSLDKVMFALKKDGFSEEKESRLISPYNIPKHISECSFRIGKHGIVPYSAVELIKNDKDGRISEVIVGPKNPTPKHVIEGVLKANGFDNTEVKDSTLSYR